MTLGDAEQLSVRRGDTVVVIPVYGAHDLFVQCLRAVLEHTPTSVALLIMDDASPDDRSLALLAELSAAGTLRHSVYYRRSEVNHGFVRTVNDAFERCAPADVILLNSDCFVTSGWYEAMTRAANDSLVATVSVWTNHGTIVSLPERNRPVPTLPQTLDPDAAARKIRQGSLGLRPQLPTAIGHCFLVKRAAIELVGPLDLAFSPGYGEEVDFSQRCLQRGLLHVLADDTFVLHRGSASFESAGSAVKEEHDRMIDVRYDYYAPWVRTYAEAETGPLARAIGAAQRALSGITISIDARCLGPIVTGTQIHTLELIAALGIHAHLRVRAVVPPDLGGYAREILTGLRIELVDAAAAVNRQTDIVHRPWQIASQADLEFLPRVGKRIVLTQQDLIGYMNPSYFIDYREWDSHRRLTRHALSFADRVVFFSHSAAGHAVREQLLPRERAEVVYIGTNHVLDLQAAEPSAPFGIDRLHGRPFLLCLGTDFMHKNRVFALKVLASLRDEHKMNLGLVFAGPHVPVGSSATDEAHYLASHPELSEHVIDVAAVDEGSKRWLLANASAMIYPSVHEGFGLVPFEAAEAGLLCAFAPQTSLAELLPSSLALIEPWDAHTTAIRLVELLNDSDGRHSHVAAVRAAGARHTWRKTAHALHEVYRTIVMAPVSECRQLARDAIARERAFEELRAVNCKLEADDVELRAAHQELQASNRELQAAYDELREGYWELDRNFTRDARGLVGPTGVIPSDVHRPLLAIGSRPLLSAPLWGLLRMGYRAARAARGAGGARSS